MTPGRNGGGEGGWWGRTLTAGVAGVGLLLAGLLVVAAVLREESSFWRSEGGFPELVREMVLYGFYPLWLGVFALSVGMAFWALRLVRRRSVVAPLAVLAGSAQWLLLVLATLLAFLDNFLVMMGQR